MEKAYPWTIVPSQRAAMKKEDSKSAPATPKQDSIIQKVDEELFLLPTNTLPVPVGGASPIEKTKIPMKPKGK